MASRSVPFNDRGFDIDNLDAMTLEQLVDGVIFQNREGRYECVTRQNLDYTIWKAKQAKSSASDLLSYSFTKGSGNFLVVTGINDAVVREIAYRLTNVIMDVRMQELYPPLASMAEIINKSWDYFGLVTAQLTKNNHDEIRSKMTAEIKDIIEEYYGIRRKAELPKPLVSNPRGADKPADSRFDPHDVVLLG
ncbi:TPA: hypothetical protein HA246_03760 [Candidatus Woesearchaeota archaeon]|nr:hypothetical protein [Candidatus Woesearchaeota archaeon]